MARGQTPATAGRRRRAPGKEFDEAERQLRAAVALDERLGDLIGLSNDLRGLVHLLARQDEHLRALDPLLRALGVAMRSGDRIELASVSTSLAFVHHELGDHHEAAAHAEQARDMYLELVPDERDTVVASNATPSAASTARWAATRNLRRTTSGRSSCGQRRHTVTTRRPTCASCWPR